MLKRSPLVVIALLVIGGTVWWLDKSPAPEKSSPVTKTPPREKSVSAPTGESTVTESTPDEVLPSPRHATGEIERHKQARAATAELEKAVEQQQEKVEEQRKALATIARTKGVIYKGPDSKFGDPDQNSPATAEGGSSPVGVATLLAYSDDQLLKHILAADSSDNPIKELYPQALATRRDLEVLRTTGGGADSSQAALLDSRFNAIQSQLHEELAGYRRKLAGIHENTQTEAIQRANDALAYLAAKRDFETDQKLLDVMKAKLTEERERVKNGER